MLAFGSNNLYWPFCQLSQQHIIVSRLLNNGTNERLKNTRSNTDAFHSASFRAALKVEVTEVKGHRTWTML